MQWLIDKVRETRDLRAVVNRKQGLLNYSIYNRQMPEKPDVDTARLNALIFERKPKRAFKANRNAGMPFNDPKRVHTALREFNDLSANAVFQNLMSQIEQIENDKSFKSDFGNFATGKKGERLASKGADDFFDQKPQKTAGTIAGGGASFNQPIGAKALENILDLEETTENDIIANVEAMLNADDRKKDQRQKKPQKNEPTLDLNMGAIAPVKLSEEAKKKGANRANQSLDTADSSMAQNPDDDYTGELDQGLTFIKKQTVSVKAGNVQAAFVQNLEAIQESLNNFESLK